MKCSEQLTDGAPYALKRSQRLTDCVTCVFASGGCVIGDAPISACRANVVADLLSLLSPPSHVHCSSSIRLINHSLSPLLCPRVPRSAGINRSRLASVLSSPVLVMMCVLAFHSPKVICLINAANIPFHAAALCIRIPSGIHS